MSPIEAAGEWRPSIAMLPGQALLPAALDRAMLDCVAETLDGEHVAFLQAYAVDLIDGHASLSLLVNPRVRNLGWPLESVVLFAGQLFCEFDVHKVYLELAESTSTLAGPLDRYVVLEGRLPGRLYVRGRSEDQLVFAMTAETWRGAILPKLQRGAPTVRVPLVDDEATLQRAEALLSEITSNDVHRSVRLCDVPVDSLSILEWIVALEEHAGALISEAKIASLRQQMTVAQAFSVLCD